ncbi:MAG: efflux RND transporter periplasmic adaptor subunit, partial [Oscillospiraceae bacterium]|nr:efflux RND transporter periplasmic adaptor subunit [Oscillospiraceae bacterium]
MKKLTAAVIAAVLLLTLCSCSLFEGGVFSDPKNEETGEETEIKTETAVQVSTVNRQDLSSELRVSGTVKTDESTSIYVSATAKCTAVYVEVGDEIQKGARICTLELDSTLSSYNAASLGYDSAVSSYESARSSYDSTVANFDTQENLLKKQIAMYEKAWKDNQALLAIGAASQLEVDSAELQYLSAVAQLDSTQAQRDSTIAQLDTTLTQLEAGIQNAKANLEQIEAVMDNIDSYGNVNSPVSGVVSSLSAIKGSYVSASYPVAVIDGVSQMKIMVYVSEAVVSRLTAGDVANVHVGAADRDFIATVRSIDRTANVQTKLYGVTIVVPSTVEGLKDGMFADVTFATETSSNAVVVPSNAILTSGDEQYVFIVKDGVAVNVPIVTGLV